ncbi:MAG: hypothetical protein M3436_15185 [Pseudomonadota bacterium]|nr:hypothetical protein [Pseudomonadota bacterium]
MSKPSIAGAASGIGRATAIVPARHGAAVLLISKRLARRILRRPFLTMAEKRLPSGV